MAKVIDVLTENNDFQKFEVLKRNRKRRHQYQQFFVEGVRNINEAIAHDWQIDALLYAKGHPLSNWATDVLSTSKAAHHYALSPPLMDKLSDKEETSELLAIVNIPSDDVSRLLIADPLLVVIFDRPSNRGNLGTIIRTCDALGVQGLIMTGHAVDLYDPETVRASMGSLFSLPTIRMASPSDVEHWVQQLLWMYPELQIVATSASGNKPLYYADFSVPTVLLIGNETDGLSYRLKQMSDSLIQIPIEGAASSLNVACATSILLYEISRQRNLGY